MSAQQLQFRDNAVHQDSSAPLLHEVVSILWTGINEDFCPEGPPASLREALRAGTIGLSLGFQPQVSIKYVPRPERAAEAFPRVMGRRRTKNRTKNLAPLQGTSRVGAFLGLKPQAESYSPFGTKSSIQPKYTSTKSKPHHHHSAPLDSTTRTRTKRLSGKTRAPFD
jgi:hypothetical protein